MRNYTRTWLVTLIVLSLGRVTSADRVVLAPSGRITLPAAANIAYVWDVDGKGGRGWLHFGWPKDDLGLEVELSSFAVSDNSMATVGLHYSVISEAFTNNLAPAVAVGIRDLPNRGWEGRSVYLALTKTLRLTEYGERTLGAVRLHAGYGSGRMGGGYVAGSLHTPFRVTVATEFLARRMNWLARFSPHRALDIEYYAMEGRDYVGLRVHVNR